MFGAIGGALSIAGALTSKKSKTQTNSVLDALPPELKAGYMDIINQAKTVKEAGYRNVPMQRAEFAPPSMFGGGQGLRDFQRYSDAMGGYFSPLQNPNEFQFDRQDEQQQQDSNASKNQMAMQFLGALAQPSYGSPRGQFLGKGKWSGDVAQNLTQRTQSGGDLTLQKIADIIAELGYGQKTFDAVSVAKQAQRMGRF